MEIFKIVILSLSGLMLFAVGLMRLFTPVKSYCLQRYLAQGNKLEDDSDMANEMRGIAGVTILSGVVILLGTIMPDLRITSFIVAIVFFFGYTIGRLISMGTDGQPNKDLVQGTYAEIFFSGLNIFGLISTLN